MTDLFTVANAAGVNVEYVRLPLNRSASVHHPAADYVFMDYSLINRGAVERVHLAHELGHCATGSFYNEYAPLNLRCKHEADADRWAIRQLIPIDELRKALRDGYRETWELAELFEVTEAFIKKAFWFYTEVQGLRTTVRYTDENPT